MCCNLPVKIQIVLGLEKAIFLIKLLFYGIRVELHIFLHMKFDGTDVPKLLSQRPIAGFRTEELDFTWAKNDSKLYYPHFDKLYSINSDGSWF